ncbi:Six-hairpin glycosidase-like protein [Coniochaeta sp. 2T2.1]|nr:Six-hairpin glycosidase-like protein [Coniochaeta sp. 2T2.1]
MGSNFCLEHPDMRDFSQPRRFDLTKERPNKTLDIGLNGTSVSSDPFGGILQLSGYHPEHGIIVAAPYGQFDGSRFHDQAYVRQYRARMLEMLEQGEPGFGLRVQGSHGPPDAVTIEFGSLGVTIMRYRIDEVADVVYTLIVRDDGSLAQAASVSSIQDTDVTLNYELDLGLSVHRASYGQLTEGGPIPLPPSENHLRLQQESSYLTISNKHLGAHLQGRLSVDGRPIKLEGLGKTKKKDGPLDCSISRTITLAPGETTTITTEFRLLPFLYGDQPLLAQHGTPEGCMATKTPLWHHPNKLKTFIVRRNLDYILGNCSLGISQDTVAIITDHVALPLGWNRDNYWQWHFLVNVRKRLHQLVSAQAAHSYRSAIDCTIKGHLNWVFLRAQRPQRIWHRSYLVTGRPKDGPVFQLDQQCYPFLELCDFLAEFPQEKEFVNKILAGRAFEDVLGLVRSKRDPATGLFPTDETPGDDAVEFPFHFSSHVLLWYTCTRLAELFKSLGPCHVGDAERMATLAAQVRRATLQHFLTADPATGEVMIAYLTDGEGHHTLYHDANDIPTIFAPTWGFLNTSVEMQSWRNTMEFALSTRNKLGFASGGPFEGLGSVHSKGAWPLGYFQELMFAHATKDETMRRAVWQKIEGAMQWDGTFGEAVDIETGGTTSKAWFSWPGSMIGAALVAELAGEGDGGEVGCDY